MTTNRNRLMRHPLVAAIMSNFPGASISMLKEPTETEINGMMEGGACGGEYLDSIGKSDLAALTEDEYMTFVERIIRGYELHCAKIWESDIPY